MSFAKDKGRVGEREVAKMLGGKRAPLSGAVGGMGDVVLPSSSLWKDWIIEVKRRKKIGGVSLEAALKQAQQTKGIGDSRRPMVLAREDHGPWYVFVRAEDLFSWVEALAEVGNGNKIRALVKSASQIFSEISELT